MKAKKFKLTGLMMVVVLFLISLNASSQDKRLSKEEKKELEKIRLEKNFVTIDSLLRARSFVLEADYLLNKYGEMIPVISTVNFIMVNRENGVLQTGSPLALGYNGVGGLTAEGTIRTWEVRRDTKKLNYTIRFSLTTNLGHYDVYMTISADNSASATITGSTSGKLTWSGQLTAIRNSRVFKGQLTI